MNNSSCKFANREGIGYDPQDIDVTLNYMEQAAREKDEKALDGLCEKLDIQIDAFKEQMYYNAGADLNTLYTSKNESHERLF